MDDFIGTKFSTETSTLIIIGKINDSSKVRPYYLAECSICSKDEELWPHGSIKAFKLHYLSGVRPCGCSNSPRWSEYQNRIRVYRECKKRGYIFNGWYGDYNGSKTKLDLYNPETSNKWNSTSLHDFLSGRGDPEQKRLKLKNIKTKSDKYHIDSLYSSGEWDGFTFCRVPDCKSKWNYTCPICSSDEYVQNGLCSGVFESVIGHLKAGKKSCRCSGKYRWTQEQCEYQINKICKEEGLNFIGWENAYKNQNSKFKWVCRQGHENSTSLSNFKRGTRCRECKLLNAKTTGYGYGYFPHRKNEKDFLYILNFNNKYLKVGRAFDIESRFKGSTGLLNLSKMHREDIEVVRTLTSTHENIYNMEQWLHSELRERGFEYNEEDGRWSIELFSLDCLVYLNFLIDENYPSKS